MSTMLSFVLANAPCEWDRVDKYNESYVLITLNTDSEEYRKVQRMFGCIPICSIKRVQNPFQYGRFKLRQEMVNKYTTEIVYHAVHADDLHTALKFTCDYRRYRNRLSNPNSNKQPRFLATVQGAVNEFPNTSMKYNMYILVLSKISGTTNTQSDYYIQYVVNIE